MPRRPRRGGSPTRSSTEPSCAPQAAHHGSSRPSIPSITVPRTLRASRTATRSGSVQVLVGREGQEVGELVAQRYPLEDLLGLLGAALGPGLVADLVVDLLHLLLEHLRDVLAGEPAVPDPLPDLRARDLRGGGVLHQVVDAGGAAAAEPEGDVLEADGDVVAQALLGDVAGGGLRVEQVG